MNRQKFLSYLRRKLWLYSKEEIEEAVAYYDELIRDKTEREGLSEEEAVAALGDKKKIVADCISGIKENAAKEKTGINPASAVAIGVVASPLFFPLSIVLFVLIVVAVAVWGSLVIALGAVSLGGVVLTFGNWFFYEGIGSALLMTGSGLAMSVIGAVACAALAVFGAKGLRAACKGAYKLFKRRG